MPKSWTAERDAELLRLYNEGLSTRLISNEMADGTSRAAVIGRLHRLRMTGNGRVRTKSIFQIGPKREPKIIAASTPIKRKVDATYREPLNMDILELTSATCRWPSGHSAPYTYCGHMPADGSPYCGAHARLGIRGPAG